MVVMKLTGFLDAEQVLRATKQAGEQLDRLGKGRLLVDCLTMNDYEGEARRLFTEWNAQNKNRVEGVAVVTDKLLWHMVVSTIGLASSQTMKAFSSADDAEAWLGKLVPKVRR